MRVVDDVVRMLSKLVRSVETYACLVLVAEMAIVVFLGAVSRYVTKSQLPWSAELASYSLAWTTFLGAGLVMDRKGHLAIEALTQWLPTRLRRLVSLFDYLVVLICLGIFIWAGLELVGRTQEQLSAAMQIPLAWAYLSIPTGSLFMAIHALEQAVGLLTEGGKRA